MEWCLTEIPKLEPLLGIGLAMNLAYLNLPIFHFLTVISKSAEECLKLVNASTKREIDATQWYKDTLALSDIHTLQDLRIDAKTAWWVPFHSFPTSILFNIVFYYRIGKGLSILATVYCSLLIIFGVAAQMNPKDNFACKACLYIGDQFWLSVASFLWPIFCVGIGASLRFFFMRHTKYHLKGIGSKAVTEAEVAVTEAESVAAIVAPSTNTSQNMNRPRSLPPVVED